MITKNKVLIFAAYVLLTIVTLSAVIPLLILIGSSFSSEEALVKYGYSIFPRDFTLATYQYLWAAKDGVLRAYKMSIIVTVVGVLASAVMTVLFAYPLSRRDLPGNRIISFFLFFTMLFNGGLVPTYMVYTRLLNIKDTIFALIVPGLLMNAFYVIMMRTYIHSNISDDILEAAKIDGASEFRCLTKIVVPLSKPIIATISLMSTIAYWNNWQNGMYYIQSKTGLLGIQNFLMTVMNSTTALKYEQVSGTVFDHSAIPATGVRMALAVVAVLPILLIYPFFQKSFVKGITLGSVKG
ncbi:carbohydrate ABC transporter permease [Lachnotalea sp. AF33-28]|uniref:carbohydrate ABC transporter permease n=1 Tax=Lachnotalea sp. AF33-28 TaxID=2292046 RepID=UPI000E54250B|nr:carbohydrate ABC transporter permease [Lachnotalea sp. AF33-28]RHP36154.1 carbohydrate ABC transporter permease [Lachnotalea sp. AF33-28]